MPGDGEDDGEDDGEGDDEVDGEGDGEGGDDGEDDGDEGHNLKILSFSPLQGFPSPQQLRAALADLPPPERMRKIKRSREKKTKTLTEKCSPGRRCTAEG